MFESTVDSDSQSICNDHHKKSCVHSIRIHSVNDKIVSATILSIITNVINITSINKNSRKIAYKNTFKIVEVDGRRRNHSDKSHVENVKSWLTVE